jgi:hypothetical protein
MASDAAMPATAAMIDHAFTDEGIQTPWSGQERVAGRRGQRSLTIVRRLEA